jgi:hypothetical protein
LIGVTCCPVGRILDRAIETDRLSATADFDSFGFGNSPAPFTIHRKAMAMKIPVETKPMLWGAAGGAIALAIVGFSYGGWMTGGGAEAAATQRATAAVVTALAPICVERFQQAADVSANLAALKKIDSWSQAEFVEKGGWAKTSASSQADQVSAVAKACAALLTSA